MDIFINKGYLEKMVKKSFTYHEKNLGSKYESEYCHIIAVAAPNATYRANAKPNLRVARTSFTNSSTSLA